jgi:hypothetical protein
MPRLEANPGEMAQPPVGVIRYSYGFLGAERNQRGAQPCYLGVVPPKPLRKRPYCKTCNGGACVGH